MRRFPAQELREAIRESTASIAQFGDKPIDVRLLYIPKAHARALHPDNFLVVGNRGAGKSLWWGALQSKEHRRRIAYALPDAAINVETDVSPGFGSKPDRTNYPGKDSFRQLLEAGFEPRLIWRAIILRQLEAARARGPKRLDWKERAAWVKAHPAEVEELLEKVDVDLQRQKQMKLFVFDALDGTADDWKTLRQIVRGLFQVLLELRGYRALRAKAFVRPDMVDDPEVENFPDASKLRAGRVELEWSKLELYNVLWQGMGNAARGKTFRDVCEELHQTWKKAHGIWTFPEGLRTDEDVQWKVFHGIAGDKMGAGQNKGYPYTWLPNHLADAHGAVSPRSFVLALKTAADETADDHRFALDREAIKRGVREASRGRRDEIKEDYPWLPEVMKPLVGLVIPGMKKDVKARWQRASTIEQLKRLAREQGWLLPRRLSRRGADPDGLVEDLEELGVFQVMSGGRINMPDVYRLQFELKRKGGIPPVK